MRSFISIVLLYSIMCFAASSAIAPPRAIEQLILKENTKYRIYKSFDLKGETIQIPKGCTLAFRGGSISNGTIVFNSTIIKGRPRFRNCVLRGSVKIKRIDDRCFISPDDKSTFIFLFSNAIINGIRCDFYRDYRISMEGEGFSGIMFFENLDSGSDIRFHNCALFNTYVFQTASIKPLIVFRDVKNVTIRNLSFFDVEEHNTHLFTESSGCNFIQCYGDCEGINLLNCYQENGDCILRSGVYKHNQYYPDNTPSKGLTNSILKVASKNSGYGLALYCGDNLSIDINVDSPHRGFYCSGISNSNIRYHGYNPIETKCHILLKDAVYKKMDDAGNYSLDMKGCSNLSIRVIIDKLLTNERVVEFSSYGSGRKENASFDFRSGPCHHSNIDITGEINEYPEDGYNYIVSVNSESGTMDNEDRYGNKVTGIRIHDFYGKGGSANRNLCMVQPYTETQLEFVNCTTFDQELGYNIQVFGNAKGTIVVTNCSVENIYVRNKLSEAFIIDVKKRPIRGEIKYIENQASRKGLVQIINAER